MSDTRSRPSRRGPSGRGQKTVGGSQGGSNLPVVFIGAVIAVVLAFVVLLAVAADVFSDGDTPVSPDVTPTETATTDAGTAPPASNTAPGSSTAPTATPTEGPDGTVLVACGDILAPVDKKHRLAANCAPPDLQQLPAEYSSGFQTMRADARTALIEMFVAAKQAGFSLYVNSSYRDYATQASTYNFWVQQNGKEYADRTSAKAGHSEHQLGTTADIGAHGCELECLAGTPEAAWILANSYKYGFIVSYQDGKEAITGYASEPWHVRFVGKAVAQQVKDSGLTLHEFLLK